MQNTTEKSSRSAEGLYKFFIYFVLVLLAVTIIVPVAWVFMASIKQNAEFYGNPWALPAGFYWQNFVNAWNGAKMGEYMLNSVIVTALALALLLVVALPAAYCLSRFHFKGRKLLQNLSVTVNLFPGVLAMIAVYFVLKYMNLTNSFWVYVIPGMVSAFNVLVMRTFMEGLPSALEESAMIDGANDFTIFTRIISPLCKPVYATVALFVAVGQWNSWFDAMLYNRMNTQYTTLQYELMKLLSSVMQQSGSATTCGNTATAAVTPVTVRSAATVVTMLPIILLYPFLQRYFVSGMTIGSVKE